MCSRRVLVMEFVEGEDPDFQRSGLEPRRLGQLGFRIMLKMVFSDGFVHADLHPGNILVTPTGK